MAAKKKKSKKKSDRDVEPNESRTRGTSKKGTRKGKKKRTRKKSPDKKGKKPAPKGGGERRDAGAEGTAAETDAAPRDPPEEEAPRGGGGAGTDESTERAADGRTEVTVGESAETAEPTSVEDLDAVLDDDLDSADAIDKLIQEAVAVGDSAGTEEDLAERVEDEPIVLEDEPDEVKPAVVEDEEAALASAEVASPAGLPPDESEAEPHEEALLDLGPVSSPEMRDRLLAQALAHAEMQDARYRVPYADPRRAGRWKGVAATLLFLVAATMAVAPPQWVLPESPAEISPAQRSRGIREALLLQAEQIEAFRIRTRRLPDSLAELRSRLDGIRYVRSGNRAYQLIAYEAGGDPVVYDSSNPSPQFGSLSPNMGWIREPER